MPRTYVPRPARRLLHLPEAAWPQADRERFADTFDVPLDVFAENRGGARLKPRTKKALRFGYRRWLGWIEATNPVLLEDPPHARVTPATVKAFVLHLCASCSPRTVASQIGKLHEALRHMYPAADWVWLQKLRRRLERAIPNNGRKPIQITSQRLFDASMERLDAVEHDCVLLPTKARRKDLQDLALRYRDALLVAVATFLPLRRTNLAELYIGTTICRGQDVWTIRIPGEQVKNGEPIEADLPEDLSERVDRFVETYRPLIYLSNSHRGLWASAKGQPANGDALYHAFQAEVKASTGLDLTLHDTRRIGVTTWAVHDPANAAGAKDLLGDRSERVLAEHYNLASGIQASQTMARVLRNLSRD